MKIRSKFKDYYDYVGHRYGEDPDVVYNRGKVPNAGNVYTPEELKAEGWRRFDRKGFFQNIEREDVQNKTKYSIEYIVAGEMTFVVVRSARRIESSNIKDFSAVETVVSYTPLDEEMFLWLVNNEASNTFGYYSRRLRKYVPREHVYQEFLESLMDLGCQAKARDLLVRCGVPVIKVRPAVAAGNMEVDENSPILKEHGIAALVPAETMWQNIYSTITNVLRPNPDKDPPVELADRDKIVKAGFDLKTSFRNPINPKPKK